MPHFFEDIGRRHPEKLEGFKFDNAPPWLRSKILAHIWNNGIWVGVTAFIVVPIFMKQSIQEQLTVSSRNILQSAEAFLVPYKEIFQFVEDIVSIKINYALSSRDKSLANTLVHLGLAASFITGLGASALAAILGVFPRVLQALTNPGLHNDLSLYPNCNIVEATKDSDDLIRPYWQIEVWKFLGTQVVSGRSKPNFTPFFGFVRICTSIRKTTTTSQYLLALCSAHSNMTRTAGSWRLGSEHCL